MNPDKLNTYSEARPTPPRPTTHAVIRAPRPSRGDTQRRCFDCDAYDECLDVAVDGEEAWRKGFDCSGCPSAVHLEEERIGARRASKKRAYRSAADVMVLIAKATKHGPATAGEIAKVAGVSANSIKRRLALLHADGLVEHTPAPKGFRSNGQKRLWTITQVGGKQPPCGSSDT